MGSGGGQRSEHPGRLRPGGGCSGRSVLCGLSSPAPGTASVSLAPTSSYLSCCLDATSSLWGRFLVIQPRTPDGGPTSLSCLANLSRGERPTQPTLADPLMCLFFSSALLWKGNQIHRPGTTFSRADAVTSFEWSS